MKFSVAFLAKDSQGRLFVSRVSENPKLPTLNGQPVFGHYVRRLMTVKEIVKALGVSKNKAQALRKDSPLSVLADFPGQRPLADVLRQAA